MKEPTLEPVETLLELKDLEKRFMLKGSAVSALEGVSLNIPAGEITGIIGRSGAGKSTLLRVMNLLERPDSGSICFRGVNLMECTDQELRAARHQMGMIFQHFNLLARRTVFENVLLPLEIAGVPKDKAHKRAAECLSVVGLEAHANAYPAQLSGGQKQRVAIARALASEAKVLLCDEATSALDPETTADILRLLKRLNKELDLTIVLITHEIQVIRDICDTVYVMDAGRILEHGPVEAIFSRPEAKLTKTFIQSIFNRDVPAIIKEQLSPGPEWERSDIVLRLIFSGESARKPIISKLIHEYETSVNIISGHLDHIGQSMFGTLIVTIFNQSDSLGMTLDFLSKNHIEVEIIGYIPTL